MTLGASEMIRAGCLASATFLPMASVRVTLCEAAALCGVSLPVEDVQLQAVSSTRTRDFLRDRESKEALGGIQVSFARRED